MDPPVVDIVIATNRCSPFLAATLDSVLAQSYPRWSVTIVDDGVPDPSFVQAVAARIPNASAVRHTPRGLGASRNVGAAVGSGEFIAFLDDDDVWAPVKLEAQVAALRAAPESVACFTGGWYMDASGVPFGSGWTASSATPTDFIRGAVPLPRIVTLVARRNRFHDIGGFDPSYSTGEDHDFMLRLLQQGCMVAVDEKLVGYRRHGGNMSSVNDLDGCLAGRDMFKKLITAADQRGDSAIRALLQEHLAMSRGEWGLMVGRRVVEAFHAKDVTLLRHALAVGAAVAPLQTVTSSATAMRLRAQRLGRAPR